MAKTGKNNNVEEPLEPYGPPANFEQVWQMFQQVRNDFRETDKKIRELSNLLTTRWGRLVESLVEGDLVRLLNQHSIPVNQTS